MIDVRHRRCADHYSITSSLINSANLSNGELLRLWQEAYGLLSKYDIQVTKEEMDMVDTMRYKFKNIIGQSVSTSDRRDTLPEHVKVMF